MLLGNGFLPMFAVAGGGGLTGATWALDGSGRAYNTPTLGAELLTNGGFDTDANWVKGLGWTISGGAANATAVSGTSLSASPNPLTAATWSRLDWTMATWSAGDARSAIGGNAMPNRSAVGSFSETSRAGSTALTITGSSGFVGSVDNVSAKAIALPTTVATVAGNANNLTAAARIVSMTAGTQAGVVSLLDSASNPQNFLIAYHDGTNVRLEKCVAGVYTNLITSAVAFTSLAQIEIRRPSGNTFQLWYGGSQRGTNQTVNDASIISNTIYGLFSTFSGNLFSEFSLGGVAIPFGF